MSEAFLIAAVWFAGALTGWLGHVLIAKPTIKYVSVPRPVRRTDAPE